jgi:phospholipase/carboxylesterase
MLVRSPVAAAYEPAVACGGRSRNDAQVEYVAIPRRTREPALPMIAHVLPAIELETGAHPDASIVWLHGLGADGNDFVPIVEEMTLPAKLALRFVFPHAPVRPVTINNGFPMRAWYDLYAQDLANRADIVGVQASQRDIEALIAREKARGIAASRIVIAGFSQGGAMALHTGLRHAERLAAIVALSCYLLLPDRLPADASPANRDVPIFMAHGTQDPVVRPEWGEASRRALAADGYRVEWHTYAMPHSVVWEEISAISAFLARVLAPS